MKGASNEYHDFNHAILGYVGLLKRLPTGRNGLEWINHAAPNAIAPRSMSGSLPKKSSAAPAALFPPKSPKKEDEPGTKNGTKLVDKWCRGTASPSKPLFILSNLKNTHSKTVNSLLLRSYQFSPFRNPWNQSGTNQTNGGKRLTAPSIWDSAKCA